jgi:hypothetical protein
MNKKLLSGIIIALFVFSFLIVPQIASCREATPSDEETDEPTPTETAEQGIPMDFLLIGGIIAAVAVIAVVSAFVVVKKRKVNEKSLRKFSSRNFEEWVIKKFSGRPSDPSSGVNGFTAGGQPLLIKQADQVSLAEVEDFVKLLVKGKAQRGIIVALSFDNDAIEGKVTAMDNEIDLQMFRINELLNKHYATKIESLARSPATFEAPPAGLVEDQLIETETKSFENLPIIPQREGIKPRVFVSNSSTKVAEQVKKMLDFLHYNYAVGDKEETTVPIAETKFGLMRDCDCAIINIAAIEQERRYSGMYILNSNVTSEINAAYLKYNTQVVLLVERKVELPSNLKGLKRIEYDTDDLTFNAAMELEKALTEFKKV